MSMAFTNMDSRANRSKIMRYTTPGMGSSRRLLLESQALIKCSISRLLYESCHAASKAWHSFKALISPK
jgi:hypothetical protein